MPPGGGRDTIEAAGAVLWRPGPDAAVEVAVIHRPRYDDWSLPKGKLDPGESHEQAALREVEEETGHRGRLGEDLGRLSYPSKGASKVVRYWAMRAETGTFTPNDEVDELRWLGPAQARALLSYRRDIDVLERFLAAQAAARPAATVESSAAAEEPPAS